LLAGQHQTPIADATQDDAVLTEQASRPNLAPARKARIAVQGPWPGPQCQRGTRERDRKPNARTYGEPAPSLRMIAVVIRIPSDREWPSLTHIKPPPREQEAARQVLREDDQHRGQRDTAEDRP